MRNGYLMLHQTTLEVAEYQNIVKLNLSQRLILIMNSQITRKQNNIEIYVGSENITDYTQENPIINSNTPFDQGFVASMVWAPLMGRTLYFGIRYKID